MCSIKSVLDWTISYMARRPPAQARKKWWVKNPPLMEVSLYNIFSGNIGNVESMKKGALFR